MSIVFGQGVYGGGIYGGGLSGPVGISSPPPKGVGYAATIYIDPATKDIPASGITIIKGDDATAQKFRSRLRMFLGEWFLDTRLGIPYIQQIFKKGMKIPAAQAIFVRAITSIPQVTTVQSIALGKPDPVTRISTLSFVAVLDDGRTVTVTDEPFIV